MAGNLVISQINGGPIGVINAIINGNFQVNQRGVSGTVTLAAGAYGHDRWKAGASGCTYTFATVNNVTTLTISAGSLIQVIEGLNLYSGTYTLSWTGTAQGKIGAGSYAGSGVTGSVTGGTNLNIAFGTGTLSLVQFEAGTVASPFERRDYGRELQMCQRYLPAFNGLGNMSSGCTFPSTGTTARGIFVFPVAARVPPTGVSTPNIAVLRITDDVSITATPSVLGGLAPGSASVSGASVDFAITGATGGRSGRLYSSSASGQLLFTGCEL